MNTLVSSPLMCKTPPSQNCFMLKMMCFYSSHASIPVFVFSIVSPRVNRTNLFTSIFSPIVAIVCFNKSLTRILSFLMKGCSRRASSLSIFETLPSTIFSLMFSGFDRRSSSLCISSSFLVHKALRNVLNGYKLHFRADRDLHCQIINQVLKIFASTNKVSLAVHFN